MKKKFFAMMVAALLCSNAFAQFSYDFSGCTAGDKIAQTLGRPWSTWSDDPGSSEDGVFGEIDGSMAAYFTYGVDQVLVLDERETGAYEIEFDVYVEEGKVGYFNVMHHFPCDGDQAVQVYIQATNDGSNSTVAAGHGTVHAGSNGTCDLPCYYNDWMHFKVYVNCDNDLAQLYFDGQLYAEWQWSLDSFGESTIDRVLGGVDFFPPISASNSQFYVDNVVFTVLNGSETLVEDSFEEYTVGNKIATESAAAGHDWWTTWSFNPGSSEDGVVSDQHASDGVNSGYISGSNDQVLLLGNYDTGVYDFEFDIFTETGMDGYFNMLHSATGSSETSVWAMQAYINATADEQNSTQTHSVGHGTVFAGGGAVADIPCVENEWMHFRVHIDCDTDLATLYYNETEIYTWQWSLDSFGNQETRNIDAANFFAAVSTSTSKFYLDNVKFSRIGGESAPALSVTPDEITETLGEDDMTTATVTIENSGNSIGDWAAWLDFGQGAEGTQTAELSYHDGQVSSGIGSSDAYTREMGVCFPANAYAGASMGMKITSAEYYIYDDYKSTDNNYIFRVYGQGVHGQPGEMLAEKTVTSTAMGQWITATFDEPVYMTGQTMWVTVELQQTAGEYPMSMDGGLYGEEQNGNWLSTNGSSFSHCYNQGNFEGAWLITVHAQGTLVPATWVSMDKIEGAIFGGESEDITLTLNSIGLSEPEYNANLVIETNDAELPHVEIPVTLIVDLDAVAENANSNVIYPNPSNGNVTVEAQGTLAIYNVAGQLVRIVNLDSEINTIDMNVENGVYFFSIYDNNGNNTVSRVVVAK